MYSQESVQGPLRHWMRPGVKEKRAELRLGASSPCDPVVNGKLPLRAF